MSTAYAFPGRGGRHIGLGLRMAAESPAAAAAFEAASAALGVDVLGLARRATKPAPGCAPAGWPGQVALVTAGAACLAAARDRLPAADFVAGHCVGEYTALVAAGALDLADAVRLVRSRGELVERAAAGGDIATIAVLGLAADAVERLCAAVAGSGCCQPAAYDAPAQVVVSGAGAAVRRLVRLAGEAGGSWVLLRAPAVCHTALLTSAVAEFAAVLDAVPLRPAAVPVLANATAEPTADAAGLRAALLRQLDHPVRWHRSMQRLSELGVDTLVELGAGETLARLGRRADPQLRTVSIQDGAVPLRARAAPAGAGTAPAPAPGAGLAAPGADTGPAALAGVVPIPADRAARYQRAGHWTDRTLADDLLDGAAARSRTGPALVDDTGEVSWPELRRRVDALAAGLAEWGIGRQDRVVVQLPNSPAFAVLVLALWRLAAIPVMALPAHRDHELRHILDMSGAVALAVPDRARRFDHLAVARALREERRVPLTLLVLGDTPLAGEREVDVAALMRRPDPVRPANRAHPVDVALLLLSGGTTGLPKLIPRTHRDYAYNVRRSAEICEVDEHTCYLGALPVGHNFALGCPGVLGTLAAGGRVAFTAATHARGVLAAMDRHRVTMTAAVPTLAAQWADAAAAGARPATLRLLQVGGARLAPAAARRVRDGLGCGLQQVYGMAEGLLNFTRPGDPDEVVLDTQGRPASPDDEVRVVDRAGRDVAPGELGELWTRGPYTIAGYFRAAAHNAEAFTRDGFYRTGDLVRWHPSGNLVVEGRAKDVINRAGEKIAAAELEDLVLAHPAVAQAAAVSIPDELSGEGVCVYAVPRAGHTLALDELRRFLVGRGIARFKLPDRLELVGELPVTAVGKVDKAQLRRRAAGAQAADPPAAGAQAAGAQAPVPAAVP